jgi:putative ABC transport system permease protein
VTTLEALVDRQFRPWRFNVQLFSFLGMTAVVLAAVGLFGLLALSVRERTREIGIRAAVGATRADLLQAFLWKGLSLSLTGILLGCVGSFVLSRAIRSLLYRVNPSDPATFAGVLLVLLVSASLASLIPADRASRISPADALRHP